MVKVLVKGSPLTLEERKKIHKYLQTGESLSRISYHIGRGKNSVIVEVRRNGGYESYDPFKAHESAIKRKEEADRKRSLNGQVSPNPYIFLRNRIDNLEFQLEILIDTIKELSQQIKPSV